MDDIITKVAQAIYLASYSQPKEEWGQRNSVKYEAMARAAIRAMRDPTSEMTRAGFDALPGTLSDDQGKTPSKTAAVLDVWLAMIDAALKE